MRTLELDVKFCSFLRSCQFSVIMVLITLYDFYEVLVGDVAAVYKFRVSTNGWKRAPKIAINR